jgi:hypothetical protein
MRQGRCTERGRQKGTRSSRVQTPDESRTSGQQGVDGMWCDSEQGHHIIQYCVSAGDEDVPTAVRLLCTRRKTTIRRRPGQSNTQCQVKRTQTCSSPLVVGVYEYHSDDTTLTGMGRERGK